ncbi:murein biosynthesis integral membrane protein MurJ [Dictyobacter kobayashii]|uniref:murein biosynthesis integral membrane protein MurJ n=1 Tax=Dictyobacter kobayashii TaxID=2014872 RepID=UPI0027D94E80|nr:murein biosynthesis integral membrane protein MurJ [Dictyobacter kobayashii]
MYSGATIFSDAFYQAFTIPDTIFNIVAGGALSSAFIPIFTRYISKDKDEKSAWHIANASLTLATLIMVILALLAAIFADKIVPLYNPPTTAERAATIPIIVTLVRIMLLQSIILGAGSITNAVLNARQNFFLPAIGTVLYNAGSIIGLIPGLILKITGHGDPQFAVYSASVGIILGALIQVGIQIPGLPRVGMHFKPSLDWRHPAVIQIGRQMLPRIFNATMLSSSVFVDSFLIGRLGLATTDNDLINGLKTESIQAMQLMQLPLGVFGMALATATFPTLAEYVTRGKMENVRGLILETLRGILFLSIPSCLGLILLGLPIVQALLAHGSYIIDKAGHFTLEKANATVLALNMFALGLPAFATIEILTRSFYAMRDSKTPVIISVGQFILKIALSLILITPFTAIGGVFWGMSSLALSTTIASILEAVALFILLNNRVEGLTERSLGIFALRVLAATAGMSIAVFVCRALLDVALNTTDTNRFIFTGAPEIGISILKLGVELLIGTIVYLRLARLFGIEELGPIRRLLDRFKLSWLL